MAQKKSSWLDDHLVIHGLSKKQEKSLREKLEAKLKKEKEDSDGEEEKS